MNETFRFDDAELEDSALQAQILRRCRRSIDHEIKNAVQALHSGLEVLSRSLQEPTFRRVSPAECVPLLRQQLEGLQEKLATLLEDIAPQAEPEPAAFDLVQLLNDLLRFLNHERAVSQAKLAVPGQAAVRARRSIVRRVMLGSILTGVDSGGSLQFTIEPADDDVVMEMRATTASRPTQEAMRGRDQLRRVLQRIMAAEHLAIAFNDDARTCVTRMTLPRAAMEQQAAPSTDATSREDAAPSTSQENTAREGPLRVLIVDDNRDAADSLALLLELEGHLTQPAYSGEQALAAVAEYRPGLVLLDIGLPDMSGDVVARRIRESAMQPPRLVSVSGFARDRRAGARSDFDAELLKPVELPALRRLLADLFEK